MGAMLAPACSPAAGPDTVLRPLEERRARAIIEEAIKAGGLAPTPPRIIKLRANDGELSEDMRIGEGPYAVAYITAGEEKKLAGLIAARDPDTQDLRLEQGRDGEIVLIVWAQNYRFDQGHDHTATAVTAERKLRRDVADFIEHVVKPGKGR
jgi:hypothetical protein